ncbi:hypothetical protein ACG7TL_008720 [Trametes sanguinea]
MAWLGGGSDREFAGLGNPPPNQLKFASDIFCREHVRYAAN